jgi:hypothetical protein
VLEGSEVALKLHSARPRNLLMLTQQALFLHRSINIDIDIDEAASFEEYIINIIVGII